MDERIKKLAKVLVNHSCRVQKGEKFIFITWDMKQKRWQDS